MELEPLRPKAEKAGIPWHICGVGPASTAHSVTRFLENHAVSYIILAGIAGSYKPEILDMEAAFVAKSEVFADLGRCDQQAFEPISLADEEMQTHFQLVQEGDRVHNFVSSSKHLLFASMATVSCSSGSFERAKMIEGVSGAELENMEGAAAALSCAAYGVRLIELRAVSNLAGEKDKSKWNIHRALDHLAKGVGEVLSYLRLER